MKGGGFNLHEYRTNYHRIDEAEGLRKDNETGESRGSPIKILGY